MADVAGSSKEKLLTYLETAANIADKPDDGVAFVRVEELRTAIELLRAGHEPLSDQQAAQRVASIAVGAAGKHAERVVELEAEVSTLRESLAEVNRLLSLNVREVERLRSTQPPEEDLKRLLSDARLEWGMLCRCGCSGCAAFDLKLRNALTKIPAPVIACTECGETRGGHRPECSRA